MKFQTYGPFSVPMNEELKADLLAKQFNKKKGHLNEASGVYIFINGGLPVYVGKAEKDSFGTRIPNHFNRPHNPKLKELFDRKAQVSLLLIALAKENGDDLRIAETNKAGHHSAIHLLGCKPGFVQREQCGFLSRHTCSWLSEYRPGRQNKVPCS